MGQSVNLKRFKLDYKIQDQSEDYWLIRYIKETLTQKNQTIIFTVLQSIRAFWLPIACYYSGNYSPEELRHIYRENLGILLGQIERLWQEVGQPLDCSPPWPRDFNLSINPELERDGKQSVSSGNIVPLRQDNTPTIEWDDTGLL